MASSDHEPSSFKKIFNYVTGGTASTTGEPAQAHNSQGRPAKAPIPRPVAMTAMSHRVTEPSGDGSKRRLRNDGVGINDNPVAVVQDGPRGDDGKKVTTGPIAESEPKHAGPEDLRKENMRLAQKCNAAVRKVHELQAEKSNHDTISQMLHRDVEALKQQINFQDKQRSEKYRALQQKFSQQEDTIKSLQEAAYNSTTAVSGLTGQDSTFNGDLNSLEDMIKSFCREHACWPTKEFCVRQLFADDGRDLDDIIIKGGFDAINDSRMKKSGPALLLSAWLANYIFSHIFDDSNCFISTMERDLYEEECPTMRKGFENPLHMLSQYYGEEDQKLNMIRSEITRLINPLAETARNGKMKELHDHGNKAKEQVCRLHAVGFLDEATGMLSKGIDQDAATTELVQLMLHALDIAVKLAMQRSRVRIVWRGGVPGKFTAGHRGMQAHSSHIIDLEDNDKALDGRCILLVTHPAVVAAGSSDGTDIDAVRVLKRATVWMGKV